MPAPQDEDDESIIIYDDGCNNEYIFDDVAQVAASWYNFSRPSCLFEVRNLNFSLFKSSR